MNALIVDDSPTARILMRRIMVSLGFEVTEAGLSAEALELMSSHEYDVVLLDWNMPDIEGVELVRRLRASETGHVPILMVTQNAEKEHVIEALDAGVDEYVMKPFSAEILSAKLLILGVLEPPEPSSEPAP